MRDQEYKSHKSGFAINSHLRLGEKPIMSCMQSDITKEIYACKGREDGPKTCTSFQCMTDYFDGK
ncbi:MAG: hypothetical protein NTZ74_00435 [Chloroflexi bacterium]|nr:hypothetical protein [Chloroflexota bacterium]